MDKPVPPAAGLCAGCRHGRALGNSRGSVFVRCAHPSLPPYPPLPVLACAFREG